MAQQQASRSRRIVVAGEDRTHRFLATRLFDAVANEQLGAAPSQSHRAFCGLADQVDFYDTRHAKEDAKKAGIRTFGRISGKLRTPESLLFVRVWALAELTDADALLVLADSDNEPELVRDARLIQEQLATKSPAAAVGVCHRDAEGWLLAGYAPTVPEEAARLKVAGKHLSFNPTHQPERLTAQPNDADTDAKRVCVYVLGDGKGLAGKDRAPSRPPSEDELAAMAPGLASLNALTAFDDCGVADFIASLRALCAQLFPAAGPA